jgi:hypothetical protein
MRKKIFEKSKTSKKIIGIRLYGEEDEFWLGYIEDYNDEIIQLRYFDEFGVEDGIVIQKQESIDSIDYESDYEKTYEYFVNKNYDLNQIREVVSFKNSINWKKEYLEEFKLRDELISFKTETIIYGYIADLSDSEFIISAVGRLGEDEGKTVYKIGDIKTFRFASRKGKFRQELNIWKKKDQIEKM